MTGRTQSSFVTICSLWNSLLSTGTLTMAWAAKEGGFVGSLASLIVISGVAYYSAYIVISLKDDLIKKGVKIVEFPDICRHYLGKVGEVIALANFCVVIFGALLVYWVLMANFLYQTGVFIYDTAARSNASNTQNMFVNKNRSYDVLCPSLSAANSSTSQNATQLSSSRSATFEQFWSLRLAVPMYLIVPLLPLCSIKSPLFFTKFNSLGILSTLFVIVLVTVKAISWGFHADFTGADPVEKIDLIRSTLPSCTGVYTLTYFCQCVIISFVKNQRHPKHNHRDILIAFVMSMLTVVYIGLGYNLTFPYKKDCIAQNMLNNLSATDAISVIGRIFMFFQMLVIYPLLMFISRVQLFTFIYKTAYPSWIHVLVLNCLFIGSGVFVACLFPQVGDIARYFGAVSGLVGLYVLPLFLQSLKEWREKAMNWPRAVVHAIIMLAGLLNLIAQFLFLWT